MNDTATTDKTTLINAAPTRFVEAVQALVQDHLSGRKDNRKPLWTLICFELWRQNYLPG